MLDLDRLNVDSIVVDGIDMRDYPDLVDSYAEYAEWKNGDPLTDEQLEELNESHCGIVQEAARNQII